MSDLWQAADPPRQSRRRARRVREQQRRQVPGVTTDLGIPDQPDSAEPTDLIGRWNILDRGVRPLVVRSDGTFTLFDHHEGRADGRWVRVSDTFVSLFVDGPRRHSMYVMPDGQVFLCRYAPPGSASTPELLFRSVLSFEGTWETPYRASQYTPAPPTQMSLGADRTFCADLGRRGEDDDSVVVWSGIWSRTGHNTATLDYITWLVADGTRRMAGHEQTTLELRDDGTLAVAALDDVFYPAPGTVRAEGDEPLATAEEPDVLLCPLAVDDPPEVDQPEPEEAEPEEAEAEPEEAEAEPEEAETPQAIEASSSPGGSVDQDDPADLLAGTGSAVEVQPGSEPEEAVGPVRAVEVRSSPGPVDQDAAAARAAGTKTTPARRSRRRDRVVRPAGPPAASPQDAIATVELALVASSSAGVARPVGAASPVGRADLALGSGAVVPVARARADDGTRVVVVLHADSSGVLRVGALPAPADEVDGRAERLPAAPQAAQMLPVAVTTVDGTRVAVVLYVDDQDDLQVGAVPASCLTS